MVIPAWGDYVRFVPEAVASVRAQGRHTRVIVVDNANAEPIMAPRGCEVVRSEVELSIGGSRNLGLSHADTEYVVFLDADDLLAAGALERLVAGLDRSPDSLALVGRILEPSGSLFRAPRPFAAALAPYRRVFAWANAVWSLVPTQGCTIMRTAAVRDAGGYGDASHGEDWMLAAALAFRGPIEFDPAPALIYRLRPGLPRPSHRTLSESAGRVRERLRADEPIPRLPLLRLLQTVAILAAGPLARLLRSRRQAAGQPSAADAVVQPGAARAGAR